MIPRSDGFNHSFSSVRGKGARLRDSETGRADSCSRGSEGGPFSLKELTDPSPDTGGDLLPIGKGSMTLSVVSSSRYGEGHSGDGHGHKSRALHKCGGAQ